MKCKHKRQLYTVASIYEDDGRFENGDRKPTRMEICERRCETCGVLITYGPARDDERTAVEVRAAEIAVGVKESGCHPLVDASLSEMIGWRHHENGELPFHAPIPGMWCLDDRRVNPQRRNAELAGYLARVIATHEEET